MVRRCPERAPARIERLHTLRNIIETNKIRINKMIRINKIRISKMIRINKIRISNDT